MWLFICWLCRVRILLWVGGYLWFVFVVMCGCVMLIGYLIGVGLCGFGLCVVCCILCCYVILVGCCRLWWIGSGSRWCYGSGIWGLMR